MFDGLFHPIVGDIVGRRLGAQEEVIPHVLLDESVAVVAADDGVREIEVFDHRLQLAAITLADLAAKDGGDLMRLADGAIGVQEALSQSVQASPAAEDEIVAILDLGKEQAMLTPCLLAFGGGKERGEISEPLLAAGQQILGAEGIGQFLQALGMAAPQKGVRALPEVDTVLMQAAGEPGVLIQADTCREREIGADAHEQSPPLRILEVDIVLVDPALPDFQVPAVILAVAVGNEDASGFPCFQNDHDFIGLGAPEVGIHEIIATALGSVQDGHAPLPCALRDPIPELVGDVG